jgi:hypothetical protein
LRSLRRRKAALLGAGVGDVALLARRLRGAELATRARKMGVDEAAGGDAPAQTRQGLCSLHAEAVAQREAE